MSEAQKTFEALAKLKQCIEVEPDKGSKKALLNVLNGLVVQLPGSGGGDGFSMWGNGGNKGPAKVKLPGDCLILAVMPRHLDADNGNDTVKFLAGADLEVIRTAWQAQGQLHFGETR